MTSDAVPQENLGAAFLALVEQAPDRVLYAQAEGPQPVWLRRSRADVRERVVAIANFLRAKGVSSGDRIAILSGTRCEWMEADLAILLQDCVSVSIYYSLLADEVGYILYDSGSRIVFAENQEQVDKLIAITHRTVSIPTVEDRPAHEATLSISCIIAFEPVAEHPLVTQWSSILDHYRGQGVPEPSRASHDDLATLVYTSGTTGAPKGVMQTHGNHLANVRQAGVAQIFFDDSSRMLVLPLAHSFARLMGYISFTRGPELIFASVASSASSKPDPVLVARDLRIGDATVVPIVPRFLEKMQSGIERVARYGKGISAALVRSTLWAATERYEGRSNFSIEILFLLTQPMRRALRRKLFGPRFHYAISGGAKLPLNVAHFFAKLEISILEGYGLTETCVATNVNRRERNKIGTVGPVLAPDIELKIAADGEILFRGPNITRSYYRLPLATQSAWDNEGWFHTGDLGSVDGDGYLSITGRKKDIIVTSGGKKIAPDPIESELKRCALISQAVMVGDDRPYCVAVVTLNSEGVQAWASERGEVLSSPVHKCAVVVEALHRELEKVNSHLASFETIKKLLILDQEFSIENGLLTPSMKVKRSLVAKRYQEQIADLYPKAE